MGTRVPRDTRAIAQLILVLSLLLPTNNSATDQAHLSPANDIQDLITREIQFLQQQQDHLSAIARLPASLMWRGVGKSGCPAPKSTMRSGQLAMLTCLLLVYQSSLEPR